MEPKMAHLKTCMENQNAAPDAVKTPEEGVNNDNNAPVVEEIVTMTKTQVDELLTAAENATKLAAQKSSDAENYKIGMMKYKDKLKDNGIDDGEPQQTTKEEIAQMIRDAVKEIVPAVNTPKKDDELEIANAKIAEMRLTMASSKNGSSAAGSNLDKGNEEGKTPAERYFSKDQIAEMRAKFPNIDIEQVYKNLPDANTQGYVAK